MDALREFLTDQGYYRVKLKKTITNHFEIKAKINGIKGNFILDTGASGSCIGLHEVDNFKMSSEASDHKATGAGNSDIETQIAKRNQVDIGKFRIKKVSLILIDLSHINNALVSHDADPIQGIIGADILHKGKAIIDYGKKYLYLLSQKK